VGRSGFKRQWLNVSPRVGVAWDVFGDGRMAVRSSYALAYDTPPGETWFTQASSPALRKSHHRAGSGRPDGRSVQRQ
jgi:hypothetical protein